MWNKISRWSLVLILLLVPLLYSPHLADSFYTTKRLLVFLCSLPFIIQTLASVNSNDQHPIKIYTHQVLYLILVIYYFLTSTLFSLSSHTSLNGEFLLLLTLAPLFLLYLPDHEDRLNTKLTICLLGCILSLYHLLVATGILDSLPFTNISALDINPTGSLYAGILIISVSIVFVRTRAIKSRNWIQLFLSLGLISIIYVLLTKPETRIVQLPYLAGWQIFLDSLKQPLRAIFGFGSDTFDTIATIYRPSFLNQSTHWMMRYGNSWSKGLELLTSIGIIGFSLWFILIRNLAKSITDYTAKFVILFSLSFLLFTSSNISITIFTIVLLIVFANPKPVYMVYPHQLTLNFIKTITPLVIVLASIFVGTQLYKGISSSYINHQLDSLISTKKLKEAVDLQQIAVNIDPENFLNQLNLSQITFQYATSYITPDSSPSAEVKEKITKLLGDAVQANIKAVNLYPQNSFTIGRLASLYSQLSGLDKQAINPANQAYQQTISLNPTDPRIYVEYASFLIQTGSIGQAVQVLNQATQLKVDLADPHYMLAKIFSDARDLQQAKLAYENTLKYVDKIQQKDLYNQAKREYEQLQSEIEKQQQEAQKKDMMNK